MARYAPFAALLVLLSPFAAHAAFSFTEIMYDASGTDTKHEWVELQNTGSAVDMTGYKFYENGSNHGLTLVAGPATVGAGGYVVIADDAVTFLGDYPSFSGTLFDSAFSLSNTGEAVSLRDESLIDVASVSYTSDAGAAGDGNSLNTLSGAWYPRLPTPGGAAASGSAEPTPASSPPATSNSNTTSGGSSGTAPQNAVSPATEEPKITVRAGEDRTVIVGAETAFTAAALGIKGEPLTTARYVWSFGNAATKEGRSVLYTYTIPGTYIVVVDASSAEHGATDRITVTAVAADIAVTRANADFIELHNRTSRELDLGLWQLGVGGVFFVLPPRTIIGANKAIPLPKDVTGLTPATPSDVTLYYPNGMKATLSAPEVAMATQALAPSAPASVPKKKTTTTKAKKSEPRVLGATTTTEPTRAALVAAAIEAPSREFAWVSFAILGVFIVGGVGALFFLSRQ